MSQKASNETYSSLPVVTFSASPSPTTGVGAGEEWHRRSLLTCVLDTLLLKNKIYMQDYAAGSSCQELVLNKRKSHTRGGIQFPRYATSLGLIRYQVTFL